MAQLALGAAGALIGGAIMPGAGLFGITGWGWGYMGGMMLGGLLFGKTQKTKLYGPRLGDLRVQGATYGAGLPKVWGTVRIAGNIIWCGGIKETVNKKTEKSGGKGSPKYKTTTTTYTYSADFAVAFGEGPIEGVRRVWADGKLIYDRTSGASVDGIISGAVSVGGFRLYNGTWDQEPDTLLEGYLGAGNVPGYRGIAYVVFDDLQLGDFGNRIPNLEFEVVANTNVQTTKFAEIAGGKVEADTDYNDTRITYVNDDGSFCLVRSGLFGTGGGTRMQHEIYYVDYTGVETKIFQPACINDSCDFSTPTNTVFPEQKLEEPGFVWYVRSVAVGNEKNHAFYVVPVFDQGAGRALMSYKAVWNWEPTETPFNGNNSTVVEKNGTMMFTSVGGGTWLASNRGGTYNTLGPYNFTGEYPALVAGPSEFNGQAHLGGCLGPAELYILYNDVGSNTTYVRVYDHSGNHIKDVELSGNIMTSPDSDHRFQCNRDGAIVAIISTNTSGVRFHRLVSIDLGLQTITQVGNTETGNNDYDGGGLIGRDVVLVLGTDNDGKRAKYHALRMSAERVNVRDIIEDLCEETGLSALDVDATDVLSTTYGYVKTQPMSARAAIEPLQQAYFIDAVESEGKLKFKGRPGVSTGITIPYDDLGGIEYGEEMRDPLEITRTQEMELPYKLDVKYINYDSSYQQGVQEAMRLGTYGRNSTSLEVPIVLTNTEAKNIAEVLLNTAWQERIMVKSSANIKYAKIEPGDLINVETPTKTLSIRLTKVDNRLPGLFDFEGFFEQANSYTSSKPAATIVQEDQIVSAVGPASLIPLDLPMLRPIDDNTGFYEAVSSTTGFPGAGVFISQDGGTTYDEVDNIFERTTHGNTTTLLSAPTNVNLIDYANTVNVNVGATGSLYSIAESQLYSNTSFENYAAIGDHNRWEIIQFATAAQETDGSYTLSTLVRGVRGTEWACSTHTATDKFVLLDSSALSRYIPPGIDYTDPYDDAIYFYKCVAFGKFIDTTFPISFQCRGVAKKPFAPTNGQYTIEPDNDIVFTWDRRTRMIVDELPSYADLPLGEVDENGAAYERYKVRVYRMDNTEIEPRMTDNLTTPTWTYTSGDQSTDLNTGDFYILVNQKSITVGDGYTLRIEVNR